MINKRSSQPDIASQGSLTDSLFLFVSSKEEVITKWLIRLLVNAFSMSILWMRYIKITKIHKVIFLILSINNPLLIQYTWCLGYKLKMIIGIDINGKKQIRVTHYLHCKFLHYKWRYIFKCNFKIEDSKYIVDFPVNVETYQIIFLMGDVSHFSHRIRLIRMLEELKKDFSFFSYFIFFCFLPPF